MSSEPWVSILTAGWALLGIITVLSMGRHRPPDRMAFIALAGGAVIQAVFGIIQFFSQRVTPSTFLGVAVHSGDQLGAFVVETAGGRWLRAYGTLPHPNMFGILLVAAILVLTVNLASWRAKARVPAVAAVMLCAWGLFLSFSRSAYLALAVGLVLTLIAALRYAKKEIIRGTLYVGLLVAIVFSLLGYFYSEPLVTRFTADSRLETRSLEERGESLDDALTLVATSPLLGVGPGLMPVTVSEEIDPDRAGWDYQFVHNTPLLVLVELGALGTMAWLALIILALSFSYKKSTIDRKVPLWGVVFLSFLTAGMFDHYLWSSWFGQLIFWLILGFMMTGYDGRIAEALDSRSKQV
jgi:O-antigen ligase